MAERQKHGFEYQNKVCETHGLFADTNYTGIWDAFSKENKPAVIKNFKDKSEIPLADIFINSKRDQDFIMYLGIWQKDKKNIIKEYVVDVDHKKFQELFVFDDYDKLKDWIKYVSNDRSYDKQWKEECKEWKEKWGSDRIVQPRFKRDHKIQKRIQSAVTYKNIDKFLDYICKSNE